MKDKWIKRWDVPGSNGKTWRVAVDKDGNFGDIFELVWKIDIRDYEGKFFYMGEVKDYYEKWDDLFILIENAPTSANCKIVQKTKRVKYFEKICSQE